MLFFVSTFGFVVWLFVTAYFYGFQEGYTCALDNICNQTIAPRALMLKSTTYEPKTGFQLLVTRPKRTADDYDDEKKVEFEDSSPCLSFESKVLKFGEIEKKIKSFTKKMKKIPTRLHLLQRQKRASNDESEVESKDNCCPCWYKTAFTPMLIITLLSLSGCIVCLNNSGA